jgi:hypothetical protein
MMMIRGEKNVLSLLQPEQVASRRRQMVLSSLFSHLRPLAALWQKYFQPALLVLLDRSAIKPVSPAYFHLWPH